MVSCIMGVCLLLLCEMVSDEDWIFLYLLCCTTLLFVGEINLQIVFLFLCTNRSV